MQFSDVEAGNTHTVSADYNAGDCRETLLGVLNTTLTRDTDLDVEDENMPAFSA